MLKSATAPVVSGPVAESMDSIIRKMSRDQSKQFLMGLGGICLGCIIRSLESAVMDGWDDGVFVDLFNSAISGTSIPILSLEHIANMVSKPRRTPNEETTIVREELRRDNTFLGFFDRESRDRLPRILETVVSGEYISAGLSLVLPAYKEAVRLL